MIHSSKSLRLTLVGTVLAVNLMMIGAFAYALSEAKRVQEAYVGTTTENMTRLIDQNISEVVRNVDLSLLDITDYLERELRLRGGLGGQEVNALLSKRIMWGEAAAWYNVTDSSGMVRYGTTLTQGSKISFADRPHFLAHRDRQSSGLIISNPILGRSVNVWVISFSRRYNHPDGSFAGIVSASVPVSYFEGLLGGLKLDSHGAADHPRLRGAYFSSQVSGFDQ